MDAEKRKARLGEQKIGGGDWISIDGETGEVFLGKREIIADRLTVEIEKLSRLLKPSAGKTAKRRSRSNGGG